MTVPILQTPVDPSTVITILGMGAREVSIIGVLLIILAVAGYVIKYVHKHNKELNKVIVDMQNKHNEEIKEIQEKRIVDAKESTEQVSNLGIKFIEQTNKWLLAIEMFKRS